MNDNQGILISLFGLSLIGMVFWLLTKLRTEKKQSKKLLNENHKLVTENALLEASYLKFQLQPHTLNNILAHLKVFANKLYKGMDSLSETLDYILYKGNSNLVSVQDEIEFIEKYLHLHDLFITEIESVKFDATKIDKSSAYFDKSCIPHLITAHFLENAFKHGDTNHPEFLKIEVSLIASSFQLTVINKIKNKMSNGKEGIGLKNMKKRLELFQTGKYEIKQSYNDQEYQSTLLIDFIK
jgi:LytS/YehU family sensor histidine kinase